VRKSNLGAFVPKTCKSISVTFVRSVCSSACRGKIQENCGRVLTKIYHVTFEKRIVFLS
jgi:hypothetical protein